MCKQNETAIALHIPGKCDIGFEYVCMYMFKHETMVCAVCLYILMKVWYGRIAS